MVEAEVDSVATEPARCETQDEPEASGLELETGVEMTLTAPTSNDPADSPVDDANYQVEKTVEEAGFTNDEGSSTSTATRKSKDDNCSETLPASDKSATTEGSAEDKVGVIGKITSLPPIRFARWLYLPVSFWMHILDELTDINIAVLYYKDDNLFVNQMAILVTAILILTLRHQGSLLLYLSDGIYKLLCCGGQSELKLTFRAGLWLYVPFIGSFIIRRERYGLILSLLQFFNNELFVLISAILLPMRDVARAVAYSFRFAFCQVPLRNLEKEQENNWIIELNTFSTWECITEALPMTAIQIVIIFYAKGGQNVSLVQWVSLVLSFGSILFAIYNAIMNGYKREHKDGIVLSRTRPAIKATRSKMKGVFRKEEKSILG